MVANNFVGKDVDNNYNLIGFDQIKNNYNEDKS